MAALTKLKQNLIRGDTPLLSFPFTVNGAVVDLTGWKITFTATSNAAPSNSDTPVIQISITGNNTGIANFQLLQGQLLNDTSALVPGTTYYWDVQFNNNQTGTAKRVFTALRGTFEVDYDYTVGGV